MPTRRRRRGDLFTLYGIGFVAIFLCIALMYRNALARRLGTDGATS